MRRAHRPSIWPSRARVGPAGRVKAGQLRQAVGHQAFAGEDDDGRQDNVAAAVAPPGGQGVVNQAGQGAGVPIMQVQACDAAEHGTPLVNGENEDRPHDAGGEDEAAASSGQGVVNQAEQGDGAQIIQDQGHAADENGPPLQVDDNSDGINGDRPDDADLEGPSRIFAAAMVGSFLIVLYFLYKYRKDCCDCCPCSDSGVGHPMQAVGQQVFVHPGPSTNGHGPQCADSLSESDNDRHEDNDDAAAAAPLGGHGVLYQVGRGGDGVQILGDAGAVPNENDPLMANDDRDGESEDRPDDVDGDDAAAVPGGQGVLYRVGQGPGVQTLQHPSHVAVEYGLPLADGGADGDNDHDLHVDGAAVVAPPGSPSVPRAAPSLRAEPALAVDVCLLGEAGSSLIETDGSGVNCLNVSGNRLTAADG
ncbi:hypothetical protein BaRGS_00032262 [Batillaria attramentaria]|uniref:Uncharacterized protein n=1 Tax=Batillaria attramentaria TaxID=370345 RepID=A0ABD0JNZ7_9CAEN